MAYRPRKKQVEQPPPEELSTAWSTWVQPAEALEVSRRRVFREEVKELLWPLLGLCRGGVAVDVGCGTGALTRKLAEWMGPRSLVYGVDRDKNFVAYATALAEQAGLGRRMRFLQGDALALPLPDGLADAVMSYTVIGFFDDNLAFIREQARVCKPCGRVSVLTVRPEGGASSSPPRAVEMTAREQELWKPYDEAGKPVDQRLRIGRPAPALAELPVLLARAGLTDICIDALATADVLDDARVTREEAERRLEVDRCMALDNIDLLGSLINPRLPKTHAAELRRLVRARYARRRRYLRQGAKVWDYSVGISLIVSGSKPA